MNEIENEILKVIRRNGDKPNQSHQYFNYYDITNDLRASPTNIAKYRDFFGEILKPFSEAKGELFISDDGTEVCFECQGKPFTDFGIIVLAVIRIHSQEQVQEYVEILVISNSPPSKIIMVEASKLGSCHWLDNLGVGYVYERKYMSHIRNLISVMAKYAPIQDEYLYSGWILEGGNTYILDKKLLQGNDWNVNNAKITCEHALQMLNVAPHTLTIPLLAIEILSLVHSRMLDKGTYFKGVCCLVAPTQSFKTTLASLFFCYDNGLEADVNFEATTAAIIRTIGNNRDSTVVIDDYKPGATKAEKNDMVQKLGKIVRMCSDAAGGVKKAGKNNSTVSDTAKCMTIVTAEHIQLSVQSTLARLLVLELDRKSVDREKLTWLQANHDGYQAFIKNYIMHISRQGVDRYCKNLAEKFLKERNTLKKILDAKGIMVDNRSNDMCVWLYISFAEFLKYAFDVRAINSEQFNNYSHESEKIFLALMEQQAERVTELDDSKRFFKALQVLLETQEAHIEKLQARNNSYATAHSKEAIGFCKQGCVYLKNNVAFQQVVSYYRRNGKEFAVSETALRKSFADNGYILPKTEKTYIHRLYVNRETYQCIQFDESKFYDLLYGGKGNGAEGNNEIPSDWGMRRNAENILGR